MKPGYKTTEFWLSLLAIIVAAVLSSDLVISTTVAKVLGIVATVLAALGYTGARVLTKSHRSMPPTGIRAGRAFVNVPDPYSDFKPCTPDDEPTEMRRSM